MFIDRSSDLTKFDSKYEGGLSGFVAKEHLII